MVGVFFVHIFVCFLPLSARWVQFCFWRRGKNSTNVCSRRKRFLSWIFQSSIFKLFSTSEQGVLLQFSSYPVLSWPCKFTLGHWRPLVFWKISFFLLRRKVEGIEVWSPGLNSEDQSYNNLTGELMFCQLNLFFLYVLVECLIVSLSLFI